MITLMLMVANQVKFCLLDEGDLTEANRNAAMFDQSHYYMHNHRNQRRPLFMTQREYINYYDRMNVR